MNRSRLPLLLMTLAFAASTVVLTWRNHLLRTELNEANQRIIALRDGAFREGARAPVLQQPAQIVLLNTPSTGASAVDSKPARAQAGDQCPRCDAVKSNQPRAGDLAATVSQMSLLDIKRNYSKEPDSKFTLFIFFTPTDCPSCLREATVWENLFRDRQSLDLSIIGIVDHGSQQEAEALQQQLGTSFPVLFDPQSTLRNVFGIRETPEKILVDRQEKVLLTDAGNQTPETQLAFNKTVREMCRK